jgi:hypothetical protein
MIVYTKNAENISHPGWVIRSLVVDVGEMVIFVILNDDKKKETLNGR